MKQTKLTTNKIMNHKHDSTSLQNHLFKNDKHDSISTNMIQHPFFKANFHEHHSMVQYPILKQTTSTHKIRLLPDIMKVGECYGGAKVIEGFLIANNVDCVFADENFDGRG